MSNILFVINPISGDKDKNVFIEQIDQWAESSEFDVKLWETTGEHDEKKLHRAIEEEKPDRVVAVGGDGTVMLCAKVLKGSDIALGMLAAGSANGMATELEIPDDISEALKIIEEAKTIDADMLCFNNTDFGLHISDIGLNAGLVKEFEEGERRGFLGYAKGVTSQLLNLEKFEAIIELDDQTVTEECHMIAFANARRYGTGAILNKEGKLDDGRFEIYVLRELSLPGLAGQFFEHIDEAADYFEVYQTTRAKIKLEVDKPFQIDGELKGKVNEVNVSIEPACLKLIVK